MCSCAPSDALALVPSAAMKDSTSPIRALMGIRIVWYNKTMSSRSATPRWVNRLDERVEQRGQRVVKIPVVVNRHRLGSVLMTLASSEYIDGESDEMLQGDSTR